MQGKHTRWGGKFFLKMLKVFLWVNVLGAAVFNNDGGF